MTSVLDLVVKLEVLNREKVLDHTQSGIICSLRWLNKTMSSFCQWKWVARLWCLPSIDYLLKLETVLQTNWCSTILQVYFLSSDSVWYDHYHRSGHCLCHDWNVRRSCRDWNWYLLGHYHPGEWSYIFQAWRSSPLIKLSDKFDFKIYGIFHKAWDLNIKYVLKPLELQQSFVVQNSF